MSTTHIPYSRGVISFFKYIYKRILDRQPLTGEEEADLFSLYKQFCETNNLYFVGKIKFYRVLGEMGFDTVIKWNKKTRRVQRLHPVTLDSLKPLLPMFENPQITTTTTFVEIEDKRYKLYIEITPFQDTPELPVREPDVT